MPKNGNVVFKKENFGKWFPGVRNLVPRVKEITSPEMDNALEGEWLRLNFTMAWLYRILSANIANIAKAA